MDSPVSITLDFLKAAKRPLLVVLGPTASGKTAFSVELALALAKAGKTVEVINADSRQLYTGMDIGTAKITMEEMKGVPHLLFSVIPPLEEITAAKYQRLATETIEAVHARGNVPMLVGGSMLYISSIIDGLQPLPAKDDALRAQLEAAYDNDDGAALFAELSDIDPESAKIIPRENKPYVIRAVEIHRLTGKSKSQQLVTSSCPYDLLIFGMDLPRAALTERIGKRTTQLVRAGWIEEVQALLAAGHTLQSPGMKSHGYPEIAQAIVDGTDPLSAEPVIAAKTRQYAKRQMTWWKHDTRIQWVKP